MSELGRHELAELLKVTRIEAGLTQESLAEVSGVSARSISDLERGRALTPHAVTVRLLADALGLTGSSRAAFEQAARRQAVSYSRPGQHGPALRALPRDIASFTGRDEELEVLLGAAGAKEGRAGVVAIYAIEGMAGIGKTALAIRAAHQLAPRFPGGQIFLPLHGHAPGRMPDEPSEALASLLQAAGVRPDQIPGHLDDRARLWRDAVAKRPMLIVLDDVAGTEQIEPLLPGVAGSVVLVTSRRRLAALECDRSLALGTLVPDQAAKMIVRLAGRPEFMTTDPEIADIARMCGHLPLALGMAASQLRHHPAWSLRDLAHDLTGARDRLSLMVGENLSVAAAFDLSYQTLAPAARQVFRQFGLHPGQEIDAYAAAALNGSDPAAVSRQLRILYDCYLLTEPSHDRYGMHDLIREHARAMALKYESATDRSRSLAQLLDYFGQAGAVADQQLARYTRAHVPSEVVAQAALPRLVSSSAALAWIRTERDNFLACLDHAMRGGQQARVIELTAALAALFRHDGPWADGIERHRTAIAAARDLGDQLSEANALCDVAALNFLVGDSAAATDALNLAERIYRKLDHQQGTANALSQVAMIRRATGDYHDAASAINAAVDLFTELGDRRGLAAALNELGGLRYLTSDFPGADDALERAYGLYRDVGDDRGLANVLSNLGNVKRLTGDYPAAAKMLEESLATYQDHGDQEGQADALNLLGIVHRLTGDYGAAAAALSEALAISRDLGSRQAEANSLCFQGALLRQTGQLREAATTLHRALAIYIDVGDRGGEAEVLGEIAGVSLQRGDLTVAGQRYRQALQLARDIRSPWDEAQALAGLGRCALAEGMTSASERALRQSMDIFLQLGAKAEIRDISAELTEISRS